MSKLHIGAQLERAPGRKYAAALRFAEFAPRAPLPRPGTLASMRSGLPADFVLALRAPRSSVVSARGALRVDAELEAGLAWLVSAAEALSARAVVFNTPADLTPGARSRELLRDYVARLPRSPERHYVWLPQGVWEPEDAEALCAELGLIYGFDPLETRAPAGDVSYAILRALGHRSGFSSAALSDALVTTLSHRPSEAFLAVDAERAFDIARRLSTLLAEAAAAGDGEPDVPGARDEGDAFAGDEDEDDSDEYEDEDDEDDSPSELDERSKS